MLTRIINFGGSLFYLINCYFLYFIMIDDFAINQPLSLKDTDNFGKKEETAFTAKMIRTHILI